MRDNSIDIKVNPLLKKAILDGVNLSENDPTYVATYVYIKMCKLLTYDDEFYAMDQSGSSSDYHKDISHIEAITPESNKIVCYEFAFIFNALLKELGIPSEVVNSVGDNKFGVGHTFVRFKDEINNRSVRADAITTVLSCDLFSAKLNLPLVGLHGDDSFDYETEYFKMLDDIYTKIEREKNPDAPEVHRAEFYDVIDEYRNYTDNLKGVNLDDRISILISKVNSLKLDPMDCYAYIKFLIKRMFRKEFENLIEVRFIRDNTDEKVKAKAVFIIRRINDKFKEETSYYTYMPNEELVPISLDELQSLFDNKDLEYIGRTVKGKIPGIKA